MLLHLAEVAVAATTRSGGFVCALFSILTDALALVEVKIFIILVF